jgi:hypothetical protein
MRQFSIRSKIILALLVTGLACLAAGGIIGYRSGYEVLTKSVARQLIGQREIKKQQIEAYIRNQIRFTEAVGGSRETVIAAKALIEAHGGMHADLQANPSGEAADTTDLKEWCRNVFLPRIDKVVGSHTPLGGLMPTDPVGRRLQADYAGAHEAEIVDRLALAIGRSGGRLLEPRFIVEERTRTIVNPYVIVAIDVETADLSEEPMRRKDFGPRRVDHKIGRLRSAGPVVNTCLLEKPIDVAACLKSVFGIVLGNRRRRNGKP